MKTENQNSNTRPHCSRRRGDEELLANPQSSTAFPRQLRVLTFGAIALWFIFSLVMSLGRRFQAGVGNAPLALGLTFLIPIIAFIVAYRSSNSFRQFANALDLRFITGAHVWRIIGLEFLYRYAQGQLPPGFALPAGIGDVLIAVTAIPIALAISRKSGSRKQFVAWNVFGLLDLFLAVGLGILHSESSLGILVGRGPSTYLMSDFPRSMIPTFFVPLFILLHLLALARRNEVVTRHEPLPAAEIQKSPSPCHP